MGIYSIFQVRGLKPPLWLSLMLLVAADPSWMLLSALHLDNQRYNHYRTGKTQHHPGNGR